MIKYIVLFALSFSAFAEDQIVRKLKEENILLEKQIQKNKDYIQARENLKSNFKFNPNAVVTSKVKRKKERETKSDISNLYLGLDSFSWGDGINDDAPTLGYEMGKNNWSLIFSYGRLGLSGYPAEGIETIVNVLKGAIQYNISMFSDRFIFTPYVGYNIYNVNSPDAGNVDNQYQAQGEIDLIQRIQDETGITPGVAMSFNMTKKWILNFRGDFQKTAGLHLGYRL